MIPASYLFKDAYKQHWGDDFVRLAGEDARQPEPAAKRTLLVAIRNFVARVFARTTNTRSAACTPEDTASDQRCLALSA